MHARTLLLSALPLALAAASLGCSGRTDLATGPRAVDRDRVASAETAALDSTSQPGFYPLAVGNHWEYLDEIVAQLVFDGGVPSPPERQDEVVWRTIVGAERIDGRDYLDELTQHPFIDPILASTSPFRQDASGLYVFSPIRASGSRAALAVPAAAALSPGARAAFARAAERLAARIAAFEQATGGAGTADIRPPGTAGPAEITRLRYPLEPKARWLLRDDPFFRADAEVIGLETLDLPAGSLRGWRIRIAANILGPSDYAYVWYGRAGLLQSVSHFEIAAVDEFGNVIGTYLFDEREILTRVAIPPHPIAALGPIWQPRPRPIK